MPWWLIEWSEEVLNKCEQRGIDPDDVEALVCRPHKPIGSRSSGRPMTFGEIRGELLAVVYERVDSTTVRIITAFHPQ